MAAARLDDSLTDPNPGPDDDMTFSSGAPRGIIFNPDTFSTKQWSKPEEAVIHIYQAHYWGNLQWQLKAIDWDRHIIWFGQGGFQMGAKWHASPCEVNERSYFYVENILEELDSPGEWNLDKSESTLYYWPPDDVDLPTATVEVPRLQQVVKFAGTQESPVQHITLRGLRITQTASTFLEAYEVPSLSDWAIHRGGAVFLQGARNCHIAECFFDSVGGNAVFMNNYNRNNEVSGCRFSQDEALALTAAIEGDSEHMIAKGIRQAARKGRWR